MALWLAPTTVGRVPEVAVAWTQPAPLGGMMTVDAAPGTSHEALFGEKLPRLEDAPKHWMRAPCPKSQAVREVNGICYVAPASPPPCSIGMEHKSECLIPINKGERMPSSILPARR